MGTDSEDVATPVSFPYWLMTNEDCSRWLHQPAVQAPVLREAIVSLRIVAAAQEEGSPPEGLVVSDDGCLVKAKSKKRPYVEARRQYREQVEVVRGSVFNIDQLIKQIKHECVWPTNFDDGLAWGGRDERGWDGHADGDAH